MPTTPQQRNRRSPALRLAGLGAELAGAMVGFTLLGIWIDRHYGTHPWGLLICAVLGLVGGLYNFFRSSLRTLDTVSQRRSQGPGDGREIRPEAAGSRAPSAGGSDEQKP